MVTFVLSLIVTLNGKIIVIKVQLLTFSTSHYSNIYITYENPQKTKKSRIALDIFRTIV